MPAFSSLASGLAAALLLSQTSAHFLLDYPTSVGFDDEMESVIPCGGFSVDFSSAEVTKFYVSGDSIALRSTHPTTTWLFRATIGAPIAAGNWTILSASIEQKNIGEFCKSDIMVPESFAGNYGTIGVVANSPDGVLYQCAAVSFVAGSAPAVPSSCKNGTGVTATYNADTSLSSLPPSTAGTGDKREGTAPSEFQQGGCQKSLIVVVVHLTA
ncbi:uncharacterized protein L3040_002113 [Drepanopeziza brunnea f. sp. 'multigermtubi']|uniref:uncharacterized protein n=1 Tax=Drepanopeziza brunnea f. sp. 'multigermtubi' TaxID=698441 RepID=UPI00239607E3|nr:hypothetical protein L3040_002113 [Drepanopeziza brunnea f. sp. 'multigermtubi']